MEFGGLGMPNSATAEPVLSDRDVERGSGPGTLPDSGLDDLVDLVPVGQSLGVIPAAQLRFFQRLSQSLSGSQREGNVLIGRLINPIGRRMECRAQS